MSNSNQLFLRTPLSFGLVNLRPLLPGHVLICPNRLVPHLSDLSKDEITDLYTTVQRVQRTLGRVYKASAFNVAMQDGKAAGQTVPHVHCHIIPRRDGDMDSRGGGDKLYEMLEGEEGNVHAAQTRFKTDAERKDRTHDEMRAEAEMLAREMEADS